MKTVLENAFKIALTIDRAAARSQALSSIAETWLSAGEKQKGFEIISEALKAADLLKHPDEKAKQLASLGRLLNEAGETAKAVEQFKRAYYLARASESVAQKVSAFYILASEYLDAGLPVESARILAELEPLAIDPASEVDSVCELINIAEIYAEMDDLEMAKVSLNKAVQAARILKDPWFKSERMIEVAEIFNGAGNRSEAVGLIQEALTDMEKVEECSRSFFWLKLASVYFDMEMKTQAVDCLLKAREVILKSEDLNAASCNVLELAAGYFNLGDRAEALNLMEKSQTIIGDLTEDNDRIQRLLETAWLYGRLEENTKALECTEKIYQLIKGVVDNKAKLYILGSLAVMYIDFKKSETAVDLINQIIAIVAEAKTRTSGLGPIAEDLVAAGASDLALKLVDIIREPEVKTGVLVAIAKKQIENQVR